MDELVREMNAISGAPVIFLAALIILGVAIWRFVNWHYDGERHGLKAQIGALNEQLRLAQANHAAVTQDVERLKTEIAILTQQIRDRADPEVLTTTSSSATLTIADLAAANNRLQTSLSPSFGSIYVTPFIAKGLSKPSDDSESH